MSDSRSIEAVILAGGKGTRLRDLTGGLPKPMVPVCGKPLLEHQVELLARYGIRRIALLTGYRGEIIAGHFGDGSRWGVEIECRRESRPLGTAGALKELEGRTAGDFLVLYGDVLLDMSLERFRAFHRERDGCATLAVHPNDHPHDSDLVEIDGAGRIVAIHRKPHEQDRWYRNLASAAAYVLSPRIFPHIRRGRAQDFLKDVFPGIVERERLYAYRTAEYIKDAGTPERLRAVREDYASGKPGRLNSESSRGAVFLDRDGVINEEVGLLSSADRLRLIPGASEAIRAINRTELLAVVVTNQPVIARNLCSLEELQRIHDKMETLLGRGGAKVDAIYFCPHHPDSGYPEERPEYKIDCECRKPKPGMILRAAAELSIDLSRSVIVGDSYRDIQAGRNAGLVTIGVATGKGCRDGDAEPDHLFGSLREAVEFIVGVEGGVGRAPGRNA